MLIWENSIIWTQLRWSETKLTSPQAHKPLPHREWGLVPKNTTAAAVFSLWCSLIPWSRLLSHSRNVCCPLLCCQVSIALIYFDSLFLPGYIRSVANSQNSSCNIPFGTWKLPALKQKFAPGWATGGAWLETQIDDQYMTHIGPICDQYPTSKIVEEINIDQIGWWKTWKPWEAARNTMEHLLERGSPPLLCMLYLLCRYIHTML